MSPRSYVLIQRKPPTLLFLQVSTPPNTRVERIHNAVGQANTPCDFLVRPSIVMHYTTKLCEVFQALTVLATSMDRLSSMPPNTWTLVCAQETSSPKGFTSSCSASRAITRTSIHSGKIASSSAKTRSVILVLPTDAPQ